MRKNLLKLFAAAATLVTLVLSSCNNDITLYTNEDLVITSYEYDDYLDPTRGESLYTWLIGSSKMRAVLTIYMDGTSTVAGNIYDGLSATLTEHTAPYKLYSGTLENGVIYIDGSLGKIAGFIDLGSNWYVQVMDGKTMVSVAAPNGDWLFSEEGVSTAASTPKATSLMTIADAAEDSTDTKDYSGQAYTTVTFPGNPTCYTPDIRYMTCVVHDDKVKAIIHCGKGPDEKNGGNQEYKVIFDLPSKDTEDGIIEFKPTTDGDTTYYAMWARKRYDVRMSKIFLDKDEADAAYKAYQEEQSQNQQEEDDQGDSE